MLRHRLSGIARFLALGILVGIVLVTARHRPTSGEAVLARLGRERSLLARISVDDRWSPCAPSSAMKKGYCRTPEEIAHSVELRQLEFRSGEDAERWRPLASLLMDRGGDRLERVLFQLEAATLKTPREAEPFVDLAAAQLTLGWVQDSAVRFVDALQSAEQAMKIEPRNARACFNRVFALEELGLQDLAANGWEQCANLEGDPQWCAEALQRARALRVRRPTAPARTEAAQTLERAIRVDQRKELARLALDYPHLVTEIVVRDLIPKWINTGTLAACWPGLEGLAQEIDGHTEDRVLVDAIRQMHSGLAGSSSHETATGIRQMGRGFDLYRERRYEEALVDLQASAARLRAVPALQMVARTYGAIALHSSGQVDAARTELSRLVSEAGRQKYLWPLGYAHWTLGRMAMKEKEARPIEALKHYRKALDAFKRSRVEELVLSVQILLADTYSSLGQPEQTWQFARQALLEAYRRGAPDRLFFVLNNLSNIADQQERSSLALYAQTSALLHAADEPAGTRANAYVWRAYFLSRQAKDGLAREDLRRAEELADEVDDPSERTRLQAEIALAHGVLAARSDPAVAVTWLEQAIHLFETVGDRYVRLIALKARAEALRKQGRIEDAVADLKKAMAAYDAAIPDLLRKEGDGPQERYRLTYLRQNAGIYQEMVDLHVKELGAPWKALIFAEHAKALRAPGAAAPQISLRETRIDRWNQALPPETSLVSYGVAGERIVAWVLTPTGRQFFQLGRLDDVITLADRLGRAQDAGTWEALSREIYRLLLLPLAEPLGRVSRLLIVPTPGLDRVPFPGLLDPRSGRYLAETYLLEMLPCASALLREGSFSDKPGVRRHALVVGAPKPTNAGLLGLPSLRFAKQEAQQAAASLGSDTVLLLGSEATPRRFLDEAVAADIIHVAGHALALGRDSDSAALVLATSAGDQEGLLTAQEILDLPLSGTDLVVLSACSSAGGPIVSWQSGLTLARSFLSAGADRVVATLHAVDDEESARLFQAFYREIAAGKSASGSLRDAQLRVLHGRSKEELWKPPSWPYVVILESSPSKSGARRK
jgi:CHAT domain-containing protein